MTGTVALLALGWLGTYSYVRAYVLYRGFGPPKSSVAIPERGSLTTFTLRSPALAGRALQVFVYLPAHYASSSRRYPVIYLLHGTPGDPRTAYINSLHVGSAHGSLIGASTTQPMIVVMPPGSPSTYNRATQWANGPGRGRTGSRT